MAEAFIREEILYHGLPCVRLSLSQGDSVTVAQHGAHVLSWQCAGQERLYLSPLSTLDGRAAIRGGVPICFPQFNQRGNLPKHGFARNLPWQFQSSEGAPSQQAALSLRLQSNEATRAYWAEEFDLTLTVELSAQTLKLSLALCNKGPADLLFTGALHTYLRVQDVCRVRLEGLAGQPQWDAVTDQHGRADPAIGFAGEFDRVFTSTAHPLGLHEEAQRLQIEQSASFQHTVVWNPGAEKCAALTDMPPDDWQHMLCVEAAQVLAAHQIRPGQHWLGWQRLTVL